MIRSLVRKKTPNCMICLRHSEQLSSKPLVVFMVIFILLYSLFTILQLLIKPFEKITVMLYEINSKSNSRCREIRRFTVKGGGAEL